MQIRSLMVGLFSSLIVLAMSEEKNTDAYDAEGEIAEKYRPVQDQGSCGSCYAFAATESLSARLLLNPSTASTFKSDQTLVSPQVPVSFFGDGCNGGKAYKVGEKIKAGKGIPGNDCAPYLSGKCRDDVNNNGCQIRTWGACWGTSGKWKSWGHGLGSIVSITIIKGEKAFKEDIMEHGPLAARFDYFKEFGRYTGGVMTKATDDTGGHAVLITAWGIDEGTPYWKIRNSWGPTWGEKGYFRCIRGKNFQGIEGEGTSFRIGGSNVNSVPPEDLHISGGWVERSLGDELVIEAIASWANQSSVDIVSAKSQVVDGMHVKLRAQNSSHHLEALLHQPPIYTDTYTSTGSDAEAFPKFRLVHVKDISEKPQPSSLVVV